MTEPIKLPRLIHIYIISLLIINIFSLSTIQPLKQIGYYSIRVLLISVFLIFLYYLLNGYYTNKLKFVYLFTSGFITIQALSFLINNDPGYLLFFYVLSVFAFIILSIQLKWDRNLLIGIGYIISFLIILLFIEWDWSPIIGARFKSIFRNPNALAVFIFGSLYFQILTFKKVRKIGLKIYFLIILSISLILLLATNSRAVFIAVLVVIVVSALQMYKPKLVKYAFWMAMAFNVSFLFIYVKLYNTVIGNLLNNFSLHIFNKNFFSGREKIWFNVWQHIEKSFLFGHGISATARPLNEAGHTSHNQYLQTFLEVGLIGFILFCLILWAIWKLLLDSQNTLEGRLSTSFFISILIYSTFELTLFQNNFQIGLIQWTIITIGINLFPNKNIDSHLD